jgi:hypothetical protein
LTALAGASGYPDPVRTHESSDFDLDAYLAGLLAALDQNSEVFLRDPVAWVRSNGEEVWSKQAEILESVRDNRYTAVHSAHDMGKSFIASRAIAWWIATHPPGTAFVVSTAPSAAQVAAIMWREVGKIHRSAGLIGKINRAGYPQWFIDGELVGYGRKPADYEDSAFQGIHAEHILVVIDEACGVSQSIYDAVDSLATNEDARVLAIGNPDDATSHFRKVCEPDSGWNVIHLDALRSPNMTHERVIGDDPENPHYPLVAALMEAEGVPFSQEPVSDFMRKMLVNEMWVEERIERWANVTKRTAEHTLHQDGPAALKQRLLTATEGSPLFTAKVRGIFPTSSSEGVIPLGWVQRAIDRWRDERVHPREPGDYVLGIDVARSGDDQTAFAHRYGSLVTKIERMRIADTTVIADRAAAYLHEPRCSACVDVIGIGSGVFDLLRRYKTSGTIVGTAYGFNAAAQSHRRDKLGQFRFLNDRAAAWWNMRELLDPAFGSNIALPDDEALIEELVAPKFDFNAGGTLKVESKDDIKKRLGRSTDTADAVIAAFWIGGSHPPVEALKYESRPTRGGVVRYEGFESWLEDTLGTQDLDFDL